MKNLLLLSASFLFPLFLAAQERYFPPTTSLDWESMSLEAAGFCADNEQALYDYLEQTNTDAFLILKDGRIVVEQYFGDFTRFSPHLWNSAGKSLMAFVAGIAVELDSLNTDDPVADYLGVGWTNCPENEPNIRVLNQLTMTSGLSDRTGDVYCTVPECLVCLAEPGGRWAYHNGPYTLLGEVIEAAVGQELNDFIDDKIQGPTGITGAYTYFDDNRIYVSNARSMARFGLLALNEGIWDGTPILGDSTYFRTMTTSSQDINPSYGYLWWLNGKASFRLPSLQLEFSGPIISEAPPETIAALGKNGQIINIVPSEGLVVIRMGGDPDEGALVPTSYNNSIWSRINALRCPTSTTNASLNSSIKLTPNPAGSEVQIKSSDEMRSVVIRSHLGQILKQAKVEGSEIRISLDGLPIGVLFLSIELENGSGQWRRLVHR